MDMEQEQQIWQRVAGELPNLRNMELRCRESAAAFLQMSRAASGEAKAALENLHSLEHGNEMAIRGMRILSGEEPESERQYYSQQSGQRRGLAQAYRRSLQARADYGTWSKKGPFAQVFCQLEEQEARKQGKILTLLGGC